MDPKLVFKQRKALRELKRDASAAMKLIIQYPKQKRQGAIVELQRGLREDAKVLGLSESDIEAFVHSATKLPDEDETGHAIDW